MQNFLTTWRGKLRTGDLNIGIMQGCRRGDWRRLKWAMARRRSAERPYFGASDAPIMLVEYGSYACSNCRAAHDRIVDLRDELGDRLAHVFRHKPLPGCDLAVQAAELAERAAECGKFWKVHVALMTHSDGLREDDLETIERQLDLPPKSSAAMQRAAQRVRDDARSAEASGVLITPTFFINGRRYDGPWDDVSFYDALLGALGYRVRAAALDFVNGPLIRVSCSSQLCSPG